MNFKLTSRIGPYLDDLMAAHELDYADAGNGQYVLFTDYTTHTGEMIHAILTYHPNGVIESSLYPTAVMARSSFAFLTSMEEVLTKIDRNIQNLDELIEFVHRA